uniref:Uncharacterized protein n=1 Tax=Setaria italica TaxID=4555 RepID=K4AHX6_SETIT
MRRFMQEHSRTCQIPRLLYEGDQFYASKMILGNRNLVGSVDRQSHAPTVMNLSM